MKKYILFAFDDYYPCGGFQDYIGDFDTIEETISAANKSRYDNYQLIDRDTKEEISIEQFLN